jgi:hypothetical protein
MAFDIKLNNLSEKAEIGYEFEVKLPDGTSTDFFITVRGDLSPIVNKYTKQLATKQMMKEIQDKKRNKGEQPLDFDELETQLTEAASIRVITWRGLEEGKGNVTEPTPENIKRILTQHTWIREQILEEGGNKANFI